MKKILAILAVAAFMLCSCGKEKVSEGAYELSSGARVKSESRCSVLGEGRDVRVKYTISSEHGGTVELLVTVKAPTDAAAEDLYGVSEDEWMTLFMDGMCSALETQGL